MQPTIDSVGFYCWFVILEMDMEQDRFKPQLLLSVSIIFGSIIIATGALYFLSTSIQSTTNGITTSRVAIATANAALQDFANLKQQAPMAAGYQNAMDKLLVPQTALITFPTQIDGLGRSHSVSTSFSFQGSPSLSTPTSPGSVGFSLSLSGSMPNILAFVKDFESSAPIILSSIGGASLTGGGSSYTMTIEGTVFFK